MSESPLHWSSLAVAAVSARTRGHHTLAARHVAGLIEDHRDQLCAVVRVWCESVVVARHLPRGASASIAFVDPGTGADRDVDTVDPAVRWAGRALAAYIACDDAQFDALNATVPSGQWAAHLTALLLITAEFIAPG